MAWERRGRRGRLFYYRVHRVGTKVFKEYCGGGRAGELAAQEDSSRRAARAEERLAEQQQRQVYDAALDQITAVAKSADGVLEAALLAAGYHRHRRGRWRKKRVKTTK